MFDFLFGRRGKEKQFDQLLRKAIRRKIPSRYDCGSMNDDLVNTFVEKLADRLITEFADDLCSDVLEDIRDNGW